ncbi:general stress protein [Rothia endophytica]|uniref:General stress protein 17M-like domain-containing protein n=1 Tax=Rothia endophytica TaxID=1324766 RepID=A0ABP9B682_9MICC
MDQLKAPPALTMADGSNIPPGELVATFSDRKELNKAVEFLASQKFPVHSLFIVGHDVKQVDYVTGQATYPRAALNGALQGIMLGIMVGVFNSILTQTSMLANILSIVPLAIAFCIIWSILVASRAKGKGIRTRTQMLPTRLDLMAIPAKAAAARHLLRVPLQGHPHQPAQHHHQQMPHQQAPHDQAPGQPVAPAQHPHATSVPAGSLAAPQPAHGQVEAPTPVFTPPAETNKDGSRAAGKFGLRIDNPQQFEQQIREQPAPATTNERVEQVRAQQSESRYGIRVEDEAEFEKTIRQAPAPAPKKDEGSPES